MTIARYLLLILATSMAFGQNHWTADQIDEAFVLAKENGQEAMGLVREWGADPYDFGLDLLAQGRGYQALNWFNLLSQTSEETRSLYEVGMAWSYRALGMQETAEDMILDLINDEDALVAARASYLLGLLHVDQGHVGSGRYYLEMSQDRYRDISRQGGVELTQRVLDSLDVNGKSAGTGPGNSGLPPRNDGNA